MNPSVSKMHIRSRLCHEFLGPLELLYLYALLVTVLMSQDNTRLELTNPAGPSVIGYS